MALSFIDIMAQTRAQTVAARGTPLEECAGLLPKRIEHFVEKWPQSVKPSDRLRSSQLHSICPREFVLNYWKPKQGNFFGFSSYLRMGVGTFLHSFLQDIVLGPTCVMEGKWKNTHTGEEVEGFHPDPQLTVLEYSHQCQVTWTYVEPIVWEPHYRISGHVDGLISKSRMFKLIELLGQPISSLEDLVKQVQDVDCGPKCTLEIKTTSSRILGGLESHKDIAAYYQVQSVVYQKLTGCEETLFWFFERNDLSSRTLILPFSQSWWEEALRKGTLIWEAIRDETLPESMRKCLTPSDERAKLCPHSADCFDRGLDMKRYVDEAKQEADEDRKWLDLTGWEAKSI